MTNHGWFTTILNYILFAITAGILLHLMCGLYVDDHNPICETIGPIRLQIQNWMHDLRVHDLLPWLKKQVPVVLQALSWLVQSIIDLWNSPAVQHLWGKLGLFISWFFAFVAAKWTEFMEASTMEEWLEGIRDSFQQWSVNASFPQTWETVQEAVFG